MSIVIRQQSEFTYLLRDLNKGVTQFHCHLTDLQNGDVEIQTAYSKSGGVLCHLKHVKDELIKMGFVNIKYQHELDGEYVDYRLVRQ